MVPLSRILHPRRVHSVSGNPQRYQGSLLTIHLDSEPKFVGNRSKFVAQGHPSESLLQLAEAGPGSSDKIFEHGKFLKLFPSRAFGGKQI